MGPKASDTKVFRIHLTPEILPSSTPVAGLSMKFDQSEGMKSTVNLVLQYFKDFARGP